MTDTAKRFEKLENTQLDFSSQLHESQETNRKLQLILDQLVAEKKKKAQPPTRSLPFVAQASPLSLDIAQTSGSKNGSNPSTPSTYPIGRGFTVPPALASQNSPLLHGPAAVSQNPPPLPTPASPSQNPPLITLPPQPMNQLALVTDSTCQSPKIPKAKIIFSEFDGNNPRGWLQKCEKFFEIYSIPESNKLEYASVHMKDAVDVWFDSYLAHNRGNITWSMFCFEVCRRFGNVRPLDIVDEFNKIKLGTVEHYQQKFEELTSYMIIVNPMLNEAYFLASFERYYPVHQCKTKNLNEIEGQEGEEEQFHDAGVKLEEPKDEAEGEHAEVSLNVMMGITNINQPSSTIKIAGLVKRTPITIRVDCGSTHNFIDPWVIKRM
ncbi:hypothetical protein A4A49_07299 [Nicotiana attenuata]|uniref:Ty3 transposon capsid-like protein domain-containing protein n=1 Tax=Nicotiana attenuata TaxID=49451 RepID=A0A1J6I7G4_NICAT|nr:hypothetical protein A4A49_07299 [Nicotiana attenuata]